MNIVKWSVKINKVFSEKPLEKVGVILVIFGLCFLTEPICLSPVDAFLKESLKISYGRDHVFVSSWITITLGLIILIYLEYKEVIARRGRRGRIYLDGNKKNIGSFLNLKIYITDVASSSLEEIEIVDILKLIKDEFYSHPILKNIDYESIPIPLKNNFFVTISKVGSLVEIENISKATPNINLLSMWKDLSTCYFKAYNLSYRKNGELLANRIEYNKAKNTMSKMAEVLITYINHAKIFEKPEVYTRLHSLKNKAIASFQKADMLYIRYINANDLDDSVDVLKQVVLNFEMSISCVHKIILEYAPPQ